MCSSRIYGNIELVCRTHGFGGHIWLHTGSDLRPSDDHAGALQHQCENRSLSRNKVTVPEDS
jgi:hypothetical protein